LYEKWCEENVKNYWSYNNSPIYTADVIVFDDPQTAGLIPHVKMMNPHATLVYRSHIEIRSDLIAKLGSIQREVWDYLWSLIRHCDIFISHPVATFVPKEVKDSHMKIRYMPATTDPCDGLNKKLDPYSLQYYQILFNRIASDQIGRRVDFERRPYFVQISRFDPSKGISDLIDAYMLFRNKISNQMALDDRIGVDITKIPQLVITGHGSIDDPEGDTIYKEVIEKLNKIRDLNDKNSQWVNDVIVVRLGPSDQMLNTILTGAAVAFQLSIREGFEVKISEALLKGIPVVAYNSGGISLQIEDGKDGYLVETGDLTAVCNTMYKLVTDPKHLKELKDTAKNKRREWILSPSNVLQWNKILLGD
jgi:glycosyltransferase involved in cell wall biosynthesis